MFWRNCFAFSVPQIEQSFKKGPSFRVEYLSASQKLTTKTLIEKIKKVVVDINEVGSPKEKTLLERFGFVRVREFVRKVTNSKLYFLTK